jgi:hypothetical protein
MDAERFDKLVRNLSFVSSRRRTLAGLTSGLFALLHLLPNGDEVAAKKGRRKRHKKRKKRPSCAPDCTDKACGADGCGGSCGSCGEGESCQDGTCVSDCSPDCTGKTCGDDGCGNSCGTCGSCQECQDGSCVTAPDDTACDDAGGLCLNGTCNPFPNCLPSGNSCGGNPFLCCSATCDIGGSEMCGPSGLDDPCWEDDDCSSNDCVGYRCR